ncbi:MAG: cation:proton antiporter [Candidatus Micrarchaeia archaeon]
MVFELVSAEIFILIGAIIFIGFLSLLFFERTKVPDVLILIFLGMLLTPFMSFISGGKILIDKELFAGFAPVLGVIALIIILFDGGFNLNIFRVLTEVSTATWFTALNFLFTISLVSVFLLILNWPFLEALLMGAVVGGSSSSIVLSMLSKTSAKEDTKTILSLESALTDALVIISAFVVASMIESGGDITAKGVATLFFGSFSIAAVIAVIVSILWIRVLHKFKDMPFSYMLSIAVIFLTYGFVDSVGGNGVVAILVFGLMLGNWNHIARFLRLDEQIPFDKIFRTFQSEVTFFVRTFYFVYMGIVFNFGKLLQNPVLILYSVMIVVLLVIARFMGTSILNFFNRQTSCDRLLLTTMMPRGLAAAVLATVFSVPMVAASEGGQAVAIGSGIISFPYFGEVVFLVILLTNIVATVGFYLFERKVCDVGFTGSKEVESMNEDALTPSKKPKILEQRRV